METKSNDYLEVFIPVPIESIKAFGVISGFEVTDDMIEQMRERLMVVKDRLATDQESKAKVNVAMVSLVIGVCADIINPKKAEDTDTSTLVSAAGVSLLKD